jgi:hypothetical protein
LRRYKTDPRAADLVPGFRDLIRQYAIYMRRPPDQPETLTVSSTWNIRTALNAAFEQGDDTLLLPTEPIYVLFASPRAGKTTAAVDFLDDFRKQERRRGLMVSGKANPDTNYHELMGVHFGCSGVKRWIQALLVALRPTKNTTATAEEGTTPNDDPAILLLDELEDNNVVDLTIHFLSKLAQTPMRRDGGFYTVVLTNSEVLAQRLLDIEDGGRVVPVPGTFDGDPRAPHWKY